MKKTFYAALGLAGACAACCAIPITLPMLAAATLAGWAIGNSILIAAATAAAALGLGFILRRRTSQACTNGSCATKSIASKATLGACVCSAKPSAAGGSR